MATANLERTEPKQIPWVSDRQRVIDAVMAQLGTPRSLVQVYAKNVWGEQYRVNVYCRCFSEDAVRAVRITDSFFVTLTQEGIIADPPIVRRYKQAV